ncbi:DUF4011 domain-containing protein [bacterium]|nr:DUF4011 domain-containing protein [bacterium]
MKCIICGKEISDDSKFCEYCGFKVEAAPINEFEQELNQEQQIVETEEDIKRNKSIDKRIYKWKEKLIDLSKRNRLLNFKFTKFSTLRIIDEQPPEVYRTLVQGMQTLEFLPIKINEEGIAEENKKSLERLNEGIEFNPQEFEIYEVGELESKHKDKYLQTKLSKDDLVKTLRKISSTARSTNDDLGYNVLFLSLGSIIWYEDETSEEKLEAPLLLVPVEIKRKSISQPFTIKYNEDSVILNPAISLKLKRDFGINLEDISIEDNEINPVRIFAEVQKKLEKKPRWKLLNNIYIGLFSFAKFVMYKDMDEYQDLIKKSASVKTICGFGEMSIKTAEDICPSKELDNIVIHEDTYQILDADSSQQQAIQVVKNGNNLVIQGPPGTGKSQTIANIISELLAKDKKVLFVSQKIAALDVVKSRLDKNGLSPFCLELHSNKTNKKRVLDELLQTFNYNYSEDIPQDNLLKLTANIKALKEYSKELHSPSYDIGISPFEAMGVVLNNSDIPELNYIFEGYENFDKEKFSEYKKLFKDISDSIKIIGNPKKYALFGCEARSLNYEENTLLKEKLNSINENIIKIKSDLMEISEEIGIQPANKLSETDDFLDFANTIASLPPSSLKYISGSEKELKEQLRYICDITKDFNTFNNRLKDKYDYKILKEDIENLIQKFDIYKSSFFSRFSLDFYKDCKYINQFYKKGYRASLAVLLNDLKNARDLKLTLNKLEEGDETAQKIFGNKWNKNLPEENIIISMTKGIIKLKTLQDEEFKFSKDIIEAIKSSTLNYKEIENKSNAIREEEKKLQDNINQTANILEMNANIVLGASYEDLDLSELQQKFLNISKEAQDLTSWFKYLNSVDEIKQKGLEEFYNQCLKLEIPFEKYEKAFETQFLRNWLKGNILQNNKILKEFNDVSQNNLVKEFGTLDKEQISTAQGRLLNKLCKNAAAAKETYAKEAMELKRQGNLQRLRKSLRQIMQSIPNLFTALKPCLMMSPSTVAQLLDPNIFHFDVIIFDEASQLTTEDCIGSIIRGDKLVVAGDTKQLPPTSFFKTVVESDEEIEEDDENTEEEKEDLDSILNECDASGFPQCMLKWHYRSKHEHLIAFSNKYLYQELYTFPSCKEGGETLGIKFNYHQPKASTKEEKRLEEAKIVAKAVMEHAKKHPEMSLGVATLNIKQKALIEAEIEKLREQDQSCEDFFNNNTSEYFFVKNLESVQGDERDVIMISVGYFKNQNGTLPMNFGPINKDGGERRLNVLITRARYMVQIFSGIEASDFNTEKTNSRGVLLLKSYLDFAQRRETALTEENEEIKKACQNSPFEEAVFKALKAEGYDIKSNVGCSGYKIDMAIKDKNKEGEYLLGIECDGKSYNSCPTIRDRDRLRREVLSNLGWNIYRIWSTDWFKNPSKQLEKIKEYIKEIEDSKKIC